MQVYSEMMLSLHYMKRDNAIRLSAAYERPHGTEEFYENRWAQKGHEALDDLRRHRDTSEFFISPRAVALVDRLRRELTEHSDDADLVEIYEKADIAIRKSIDEMQDIARKDLGFFKTRRLTIVCVASHLPMSLGRQVSAFQVANMRVDR